MNSTFNDNKTTYEIRGVSHSKDSILKFVKKFFGEQSTFCKITYMGNERDTAYVLHSDTAGTKTLLHYIYWKETGDIEWWKYIAWDALAMNLNDIACSGFLDNIIVNSIISRNTHLIPDIIVEKIMEGTIECINMLRGMGVSIEHGGGETADVPDILKTIDVGCSVFAYQKSKDIIKINIEEGNVIVGIPSWGKTYYEPMALSGISCNGITSIRHELLSVKYRGWHETYSERIPEEYTYRGTIDMENIVCPNPSLFLSPTRIALPILKALKEIIELSELNGIIHITGGGHKKVLRFVNKPVIIAKSFSMERDIPPLFRYIIDNGNISLKEMFSVFNMGLLMEIYVRDMETAQQICNFLTSWFNIPVKIIGEVIKSSIINSPCVEITLNGSTKITLT